MHAQSHAANNGSAFVRSLLTSQVLVPSLRHHCDRYPMKAVYCDSQVPRAHACAHPVLPSAPPTGPHTPPSHKCTLVLLQRPFGICRLHRKTDTCRSLMRSPHCAGQVPLAAAVERGAAKGVRRHRHVPAGAARAGVSTWLTGGVCGPEMTRVQEVRGGVRRRRHMPFAKKLHGQAWTLTVPLSRGATCLAK